MRYFFNYFFFFHSRPTRLRFGRLRPVRTQRYTGCACRSIITRILWFPLGVFFNLILYTGVLRDLQIFFIFLNTIGRSLQDEKKKQHDSFVRSSSLTFLTVFFSVFIRSRSENPLARRPRSAIDHKNGQRYTYVAGVSNHVLPILVIITILFTRGPI